jgi:hypothetical protein
MVAAMVHHVFLIDACLLRDLYDKHFHVAKPAKIISILTAANNENKLAECEFF